MTDTTPVTRGRFIADTEMQPAVGREMPGASALVRESQASLLLRLVDLTDDLFIVSNLDSTVVWANEAASLLHGIPHEDLVGTSVLDYVAHDAENLERFYALSTAIHNESHRAEDRIFGIDANGNSVELWTITVFDPQTQLFYTVKRDTTDLAHAEQQLTLLNEQLRELSLTDPLTGLANRRALFDRLIELRTRSETATLLLLDLDRFKVVNDSLGHAVGDSLLQSVAHRLKAVSPLPEFVARLGGDEFALLITGDLSPLETEQLQENLLLLLAVPHTVAGRRIDCSASVGAAKIVPTAPPEEMLRQVDLAMYSAKAAGGSRVEFFDEELRERSEVRYAVEAYLRESIEQHMLFPAGQQIHDATSRSLACIEVLARWSHPELAQTPVESLIEIAEEAALLDAITFSLVREVTRLCGEQDDWPLLTINVAPSQLTAPDFVPYLLEAVMCYGGRPDRFIIEMTETGLTGAIDNAAVSIDALASAGFRLMIDDFGKGASALSYLRDLPLAGVKIDGSFVQNIQEDPVVATITQSVIELVSQLDLISVAEWVETEAQLRQLQKMGCDWIQGFLLHQPEPFAQVISNTQRDRPQ